MKYTLFGIVCILLSITHVQSQNVNTSGIDTVLSVKQSEKYVRVLGEKSEDYTDKMSKGTEKYLAKLKSQEQLLNKQLAKIDSSKAKQIFEGSKEKYDQLQKELNDNAQNVLKSCGKYVPGIDSAVTSLKFLEQSNIIPGSITKNVSQYKDALSKIKTLEDQFKKTDNVEDFIRLRKEYLQQQLASYNLPGLGQYNQQAAYYAQEMNELKEAWDDPSKIETKAMTLLNKMPAFQEFMKQNSALAELFNLPGDYGTSGVAGLQTKDDVQRMIQQSIGNMGATGAQTASQNISEGQNALSELRGKLNKGGSDLSMPEGQRNNQHTKSLFKRLDYGFDVQSTKSNNYFPNQSTIALTAAYKLNDRNSVGFGISYSVGWGKDIQHISVTSQGIGFRSFMDLKIKGSLYGTGGFEYNYAYPFNTLTQLKSSGMWQKSGLIGLTKMISVRSNMIKKTKLQLLWNFLSYYQSPQTQPIVFRVGYNF